MFTLTIETRNAAFGDTAEETAAEVARILRDVGARLERNGAEPEGYVRDVNGNRVGEFTLTLES